MSRELPLAPPVYFDERAIQTRYHCWYHILIRKLYRLCTHTLKSVPEASPLGKAVRPSLHQWEKAFKVQMSKEWVNLLNEVQLDAIYEELCRLAKYVFALNAR